MSRRGRDIEGFAIHDQESPGGAARGRVGGEPTRCGPDHPPAKGLEFKVVVVADAGRDLGGAAADDPGARDFGWPDVDPGLGERRAVFGYEVRSAGKAAERDERLRPTTSR
jgi:hypothetical protein